MRVAIELRKNGPQKAALGRAPGASAATASPRSEAIRVGAIGGPGQPGGVLLVSQSEDGEHVAITRPTLSGFEVVADGRRHGTYAAPPPVTWSAQGGRSAYWATRADQTTVLVVDGRESKPDGRDLGPAQPNRAIALRPSVAPSFSPDGRHVTAGAQVSDERGTRTELWMDGDRVAEFSHMDQPPVWSPDGKCAVVAMRGGQWSVWVDGWERGGYDAIVPGSLGWNADGTLRYAATRSGRHVLFLGDAEIEAPAQPIGPIVRNRSGKLAFSVFAARQHQLVVDDRIHSTHDAIVSLQLTPDRERFVYVATDGGKQRIVFLGQGETEPAERVNEGSLAFRPDGACLAYAEFSSPGWWIVEQGVPGRRDPCRRRATGPFQAVGPPAWGEDGRTLSFAGIENGEGKLFVGRRELTVGPLSEQMLRVVGTADGRVSHLAVAAGWLYRVARETGDRTASERIARSGSRPRTPDAPGVSVHEIADMPTGTVQLTVHDGAQRVAWLDTSAAVRKMVVDGRVEAESQFLFNPPVWSADGHLMYTSGQPGVASQNVVVDGRVEARLSGIVEARFAGRTAAFVVTHVQGNQYNVFSSTTRRSTAIGVSPPQQVAPSPDGAHLAVVTPEFPARLLVDGRVAAKGFPISRPVWSDDGRHWMATVQDPNRGRGSIFVDGRAVEQNGVHVAIGFDASGTAIYTVASESGAFLVKGDVRGPTLRQVLAESVVFDGARRHLAYFGIDRGTGRTTLVKDAEEVRGDLAAPCCISWSPDGRLAWAATIADARAVLIDRRVVAAHDDVVPGTLQWSGRSVLSYVAMRSGDRAGAVVVLGDDEHGPYDEVAAPGVSFHGERAAWMARRDSRWLLVVDGREVASADDLAPGAKVTWTEDGVARVLVLRESEREGAPVRRIVSLRYDPRRASR